MSKSITTDRQKANNTLELLLDGIKKRDKEAIRELFSKQAIEEAGNFEESLDDLLCFFKGEIISYDDWAGVGTDGVYQDGKKRTELQSSFDITTSEQTYHMAIKECTIDTFDQNNVGVMSVYIITADNWKKDVAYRGDGKWTPGIVIKEKD